MSVIHPHFGFVEDCLPLEAALWWRDHSELFLRVLTSPRYRRAGYDSDKSGNLLIYPPKCDIKETILNGRKSTKPSTRPATGASESLPFQWINIPLTPEDLAVLSTETAGLEQLSLAYISLGAVGLGLSVKFDFTRKSYTVCIYGPDNAANMRPCGISGQSPDLRDALLVCLYKFNNRLQGSFDGSTGETNSIQSGRFK